MALCKCLGYWTNSEGLVRHERGPARDKDTQGSSGAAKGPREVTGALVRHSTMKARCLLLLAFTEWWGVALDARIIIGLPAIVKSTPLPRCVLTTIGSYCG